MRCVRIKTEDTDEDINLETDDEDSGNKDIKAKTDDEDEALVKVETDEYEKLMICIKKNIKEEETDDKAEIQTTGLSHLEHAHGKKSEKKVDKKKIQRSKKRIKSK